MNTIIKSTLKLLFRNKGFWFFFIITPVISSFILKLEQTNLGAYEIIGETEVVELEKPEEKVAYYGGKGKYVVKVYDACDSRLSNYMLKKLLESGAIIACRVKVPDMTKEDVDNRMEIDGFQDRMGSAIYIGKDFDTEVLSGNINDNLVIYNLSSDERNNLLENEVKLSIGQMRNADKLSAGGDIYEVLKEMNKTLPSKKIVSLADKNSVNLSNEQLDQKALMGYALAILTLGFVFGGIFVAHTAISEQEDMVLTRIKLTNLSNTKYFAAKFITGGLVSFILTTIMAFCTLGIGTDKLGMGRISFLVIIFLLGVIFSSISLLLGILLGNVMSANVAAFTLWSMSSLLAGLYFPLDSTTKAVKTLSYMMPQKWFMDATELLMVKDNSVYFMIICVTIAYMIITLSLGSVGIKYKNYE
jgi:ABC-type multidrug transport system permease subunit